MVEEVQLPDCPGGPTLHVLDGRVLHLLGGSRRQGDPQKHPAGACVCVCVCVCVHACVCVCMRVCQVDVGDTEVRVWGRCACVNSPSSSSSLAGKHLLRVWCVCVWKVSACVCGEQIVPQKRVEGRMTVFME